MTQLTNYQDKEADTKADMSISGIYKQIWAISKLKRRSPFYMVVDLSSQGSSRCAVIDGRSFVR